MSRPFVRLLSESRRTLLVTTGAFCLALQGCEGEDSPSGPDPSHPATIALSVVALEFSSLSDTEGVNATVYDQYGSAMLGAGVSWSSSDDQVASVTQGGLVEAVGNGSAIVSASSGSISATVQISVQQVVTSIRFEERVVTTSTGAASVQMDPIGEDANGFRAPLGALTWSTSAPGTAVVDGTGKVTGVSPGWAIVQATGTTASGSVIVHAISPGFPGPPPDVRALHLGGNWLGNQLHAGVPHPDYDRFIQSLDVNWVGVSVALHYGVATDPVVRRIYDGDVIKTFTDEVLRTLIREFQSRGIDVYVTLAFETEEVPEANVPSRWMLGLPGLLEGFEAEEWPWLPEHPNHDNFVAEFWASYTAQAVHFARIAEEEGAALFSLGTETDHLFRTRAEGDYVSEYGDEIRNMVSEVKSVFSGLVTYDQLIWVLQEPEIYGVGGHSLWEDGGFDAIGLSAWFRLVEEFPTSVMTVEELQEAWEPVFADLLVPLQQANPGLPIFFTEFGFIDDIRAPADAIIDTYAPKVFMDLNGNGLDDGQEAQANIIEAFYRTLDTSPVVAGAFWWDHAMDSDADVEASAHLQSQITRGKLAESVVRLAYGGGG